MAALTFGLTLVRHGETKYNEEGLLQGQGIDSVLSEIGLQQAEAAGCYLKDVEFTNVFVSDMLRAQQTADTIVKHNSSCSALRMVCDPLLKEKSFGIAEGRRVQELIEMAQAAGQPFTDFTPPKGETHDQVKERVKEFLEKMLQQIGAERWRDRGGMKPLHLLHPKPLLWWDRQTMGSGVSRSTLWSSPMGSSSMWQCASLWRSYIAPCLQILTEHICSL